MELTVQKREKLGKAAKFLQKEGLIPAELYGKGVENVHLSVDGKEFQKVFKLAGESTLINIVIDDKKTPVMIQDVSSNPITDEITNIDFYQVKMDEKITVGVPLEFVNDPPAVKNKGGVLVKAMQELEVEALPVKIPHSIDVDLSSLEDLNQSLYVKDLKVSEDVKILIDLETVIATIKEPEAEKAPETESSVEDIKVEGEDKITERQSQKQEAEAKKQAEKEAEKQE